MASKYQRLFAKKLKRKKIDNEDGEFTNTFDEYEL
jgi:hypothetical protein